MRQVSGGLTGWEYDRKRCYNGKYYDNSDNQSNDQPRIWYLKRAACYGRRTNRISIRHTFNN